MLGGSATDSNSKSNGKDLWRNMTHGRTPMTLILMLDLASYRTEMMISTLRRTPTGDIQTLLGELTLLPFVHNLLGDGELVDRSVRTLTLGGEYCDNITCNQLLHHHPTSAAEPDPIRSTLIHSDSAHAHCTP
jgi:hypothetical protein